MRHTVTAAILLPLLILSSACSVFADRNDTQKFTIDGVRIEVPYPAAVTEARVPIAYGSHKKTRACSNEETGDPIHGVFDDRGLYHPIVHTPYVPGRFSSMRSLPEEQEWDCGIVSQVGPHDLWFNLDKKYLGTPYLEAVPGGGRGQEGRPEALRVPRRYPAGCSRTRRFAVDSRTGEDRPRHLLTGTGGSILAERNKELPRGAQGTGEWAGFSQPLGVVPVATLLLSRYNGELRGPVDVWPLPFMCRNSCCI